jgi:hypothetical protein
MHVHFPLMGLKWNEKERWNGEKEVQIMRGSDAKVCAVSDESLLASLSKNPEVICARCGAKSHDKSNVCEPVAIEPDH